MKKTTSPETQTAVRHLESVDAPSGTLTDAEAAAANAIARRAALRDRHAQRLTTLMEQRRDLRGVHQLADFVDDAIRWTA
ncbi:hypothetical protein [Nocardioides sp. WS12]|uniref:hypothetical protein n=1 Tax=Nocardioides sp. WS12 TaxID=2486272 RepID=UPI0015FB69AE|nr:hypothetical protein [Nocardioides sp. WS12]